MNYLFNITMDDYFEVIELAKKNGKKPGDSMQKEFLEIMKKKNIKHFGVTELNKKELIQEYNSHNKNILNIETNSEGKTNFKINNDNT
jgi:hypothetical protein